MSSRVRNPYKFPIQSRALGDAEHGGKIFLVAEEHVEFADDFAIDLLRFGFTADQIMAKINQCLTYY